MFALITRIRQSAFSREILLLVALFVLSVLVFVSYSFSEKRVDRANEQRQESFILADELRQSSDDLTRMARTYVVTGKSIYKEHYQEIIDIRNGVINRPAHYQSIYWDLVPENNTRPYGDSGQKISLLGMMRQAGFTDKEFAQLRLAKENSDALSKIEFDAMHLSEAKDAGAEEAWQRARLMMYSQSYHVAKASIMQPIAEFYRLMEQRTSDAVESAENLALTLRLIMMVLIAVLVFSMWRAYAALRNTLGGSVDEVRRRIDKIASGNFLSTTIENFHQQNTVAGWLTSMQNKLLESDRQQQHLTDRLAAEKERAQVTLSCIGDAVMTTDAFGNVTFLNDVAVKLTGWKLSEAAGKPLHTIFNIVNEATRQSVVNPVDQVLQEHKTVLLANHTVLIARDGTEYNIEDSAAPIFLENGELLGCVLVFHDVTEKHGLLRDVRWQAGHDVLTGLPNRALLADRFERALATAQRHQDNLVVCLLDLDEFKPVNDTYGHAVGDRLLVKAANRLTAIVRAEDTVARMGGDEFVLLLGGVASREEVHLTLERILNAMSAPYLIDGKTITVSGSIGAVLYPEDDADSDTLLRHADQAMYQAKQSGRNRYHFFDVLHDKEIQTTHQTLERVSVAIQDHELCLYYQPKVNMRTGVVVGMEALLRWQHPQRGILSPDAFLPVIEQTDLIVDIGEWVIDAALRQIADWQQQGVAWVVSANIAARHFQNPDFLHRLKIILARHASVPPQLLQIEILETVAQRDIEQVRELILQCQALGVSFALDDFGTGYSSLNYLKYLPAKTLKIDQSFVRDMLDDQEDLALVEAIIGLAKAFDRDVVAEGVESSEHGVLLMRLGCDVAQGYAIARPMPALLVLDWSKHFVSDEKWKMWADVDWSLNDFPLLMAARDHVEWVAQVVKAVDDNSLMFIESALTNHKQCRFGLWYYGEGKTHFGHLQEFADLDDIHLQVHRVGAEIVRLRDVGEIVAAKALCAKLLILREQVLAQLSVLQLKVSDCPIKAKKVIAHQS